MLGVLKARLIGSALAFATVIPSAALAQTATQSAVEEVTVTARRISENIQSVPIAVTAISAESLNRENAENLGALQGQVPNLNIVQGRASNSSANIFIRGVGQPDALMSFDPGVGVYVNDVYMSRIQGALLDVYDVSRIEVLNGPQGTLYGKNTIGGAVKIYTYQPTDEFEGAAQADYGSYDDRELRAHVSGPISDEWGYALMGYVADREGYAQDPISGRHYNSKNTWAGRGILSWTPSAKLKFDLGVDFTDENPSLSVGKSVNALYSTDLGFGTINIIEVPKPGQYNYKTAIGSDLPNHANYLHHAGMDLTATYEINSDWTFKSITSWRNLAFRTFEDIDATPAQLGDVKVAFNQHQYSQEFQLLYSTTDFHAVGGVYALRENVSSDQFDIANNLLTFFGLPLDLTKFVNDDLTTTSYAAYGSADYDFAPGWTLSAGLRGTYEKKDYSFGYFFTGTLALPGFDFAAKDHWSDLSPSFTLSYKPTDDTMLYARAAKGFKSGGFNGRADNIDEARPFKPETLWSYEIGAKTSWFDDRLVANGDVFYGNYKDFQARISTGSGITGDFAVLNAGKLKQYGAELELFARPTDQLQLDAEIGLLHASYDQFLDPQFGPGDPRDNRSWETPAFAPHVTARLGALYTVSLGGNGFLDFAGDWNYRARQALAVDNSDLTTHVPFPGMFAKSYTVLNGRIEWRADDERWYLAAFGRNLTNKVYAVDAQEFSSVAGIRTTYFGEPRTFGVEAGVRF